MTLSVAHSCNTWLPLTEGWLDRQIRFLPLAEIEAHIICESTQNLDTFAWPNIHTLPRHSLHGTVLKGLRKLGMPFFFPHAKRAIAAHNIKIVHSHFGNRGWLDLGLVKQTGAKQVVTFYGWDVNHLPQKRPIWRQRYQEMFAQAELILCEGSHMRQSLLKLGANPDRTRVQHLGVAVDEILFQTRQRRLDEPLKVLLAATFTPKKGLPDGLEAMGRLRQEQGIPLQITIIGDARATQKDQAEKQKILAALDRWNLRPFTRLLGYQPYATLFAEAYQHHIFLSPSRTAPDGDTEGGAPVSLIDMQATGMPVVSTTHCDIPEVVQHGRTGLLAAEGDIVGLVQHLHWLAENPDAWAGIGTAGRQHIEQEYDARRQGQRLAKIYQELG
ncbi:MAG: glycosyltransferase [Chloroflexi bacterium]|nr:glycosyltransferase [Chloroflexota bacterium]